MGEGGEVTKEQWNELYRKYPGDIVKHLTDTDDLICLWAAEVIENLRKDDTALREHDEEVRKPLVEALEAALSELKSCGAVDGFGDPIEPDENVIKEVRDALSKVKE
jgi:hypothetical protein